MLTGEGESGGSAELPPFCVFCPTAKSYLLLYAKIIQK